MRVLIAASRKTVPLILSAVTLILASSATFAQDIPNSALASQLLRKSGMDYQLEQKQAEMRVFVENMSTKEAPLLGISPAELRAALALPDLRAITDSIAHQIAKDLSRVEIKALLDWYSTPLGEKSVQLLYSVKPEESAAIRDATPSLLGNPRRVATALSIAQSTEIPDLLASLQIATTLATAEIAAVLDPATKAMIPALREGMELQRPQLRTFAQGVSVVTLLYSFRSLSDEELEQYSKFTATPAARRFLKISNSNSLKVISDLVQGIGPALSRSSSRASAGTGQSMGLSVQTLGNVTNVTIISVALGIQNQLFSTIRTLPPSDDEAIVNWIKRHQIQLPPQFLYELARRVWAKSHDEAFEWFSLGSLRARYDAFRCTDSSAPQGILMLPGIAQNVAEGIDKERATFGAAGLRALARKDRFSSNSSPWWICSHGMGAINAAINKRALSEWLTAESSWAATRERLQRDLTRYFEEQSKPQDDPIAMAIRPYETKVLATTAADKLIWLDGRRVVFTSVEKNAEGKTTRTLRAWNRSNSQITNIATLPSSGFWCAGNGNIYYQTMLPQKEDDGRMKLSYALGTPENPVVASVVAKGFFPHANQSNDGSQSWSSHSNAWRQSPHDCRWLESARLSGPNSLDAWIPLLPDHGFLRLQKGDSTSQNDRLQYFSREDAAPIALPINAASVSAPSIAYYPFKKAYFIAGVLPRRSDNETRRAACIWWLTPGSGKTEEACVPADLVNDNPVTFAPAQAGILRRVYQRNTPHGPKPGGIYLTDGDGRSEKILEGTMGAWAVSPDGCAVAAKDGSQIKVIEICR